MSMTYIRKHYNVPAKKGMKVTADDCPGVITGARGAHLRILLDGMKCSQLYHPAWNIQFASLSIKTRAARIGCNPATGGIVNIPKARLSVSRLPSVYVVLIFGQH